MRKSTGALLLAAIATTGCMRVNAQGNGPTVNRNYQVGDFQQIEVAGSYDVEVRTGAKASVSARGGSNLLDHTVVEVSAGKLIIHPETSRGFFNFGHFGHATFTVTVPQLTGTSMAGSGDIKVDRIQGSDFKGNIAGSGSLKIGALEVQTLKLSIAGSGDAAAAGKAQSAQYEIAGSGDIDAAGVETRDAKLSISGSGGVKAHAVGTADVSIMGSGDAEIAGGAKCSISKVGSGSVRCS